MRRIDKLHLHPFNRWRRTITRPHLEHRVQIPGRTDGARHSTITRVETEGQIYVRLVGDIPRAARQRTNVYIIEVDLKTRWGGGTVGVRYSQRPIATGPVSVSNEEASAS